MMSGLQTFNRSDEVKQDESLIVKQLFLVGLLSGHVAEVT